MRNEFIKYRNSVAVPFFGGRCYACDRKAVGFRDKREEGGELEAACTRHADPRVKVRPACIYCSGTVRKGSLVVGDMNVHAACQAEQSR